MKKIFSVFIFVALAVSFLPHLAYATGTFQLLSPSSLPDGSTNVPYFATINFIYSGSYAPGVSVIGNYLPEGLVLGTISQGANGVDSITLSGTPTTTGNYPIKLILNDNNGALLTQSYTLNISYSANFTLPTYQTTSLTTGTILTSYFDHITLLYNNGSINNTPTPNITFTGLPTGLRVGAIESNGGNMNSGSLQMQYTVVLSGTPYVAGNFSPIMSLNDGSGATASFTFNLQILNSSNSAITNQNPVNPITPNTNNSSNSLADPVGTNILTPDGTVSMISSDGTRRPYTSAGAFLSYGFNSWGGVVTASASDIALPVGSFIPPRDGKIICSNKGSDVGTCYLITNSQKAGFTSAEVFKGLGFSFDNTTAGDVSWMTSASSISSVASAHLPGTLINNNGTYEIVSSNGFIGIPDATTLQSWGYSFSDATIANSADKMLTQISVLTSKQAGQLTPQ
jgi:hypothetical protein